MMRANNIILLFVVAFIGGGLFFITCKYACESKVYGLKKKAKDTFVKAIDQEVKNRYLEGPLSFYSDSKFFDTADIPDSVYWEDASGKHLYRLDPEKHRMNVTVNTNIRSVHSFTFGKTPLLSDSLNAIWRKYLIQSHISAKSALCISVTDSHGCAKSQNTIQSEWIDPSNLMFTVYLGYACEIEIKGYLHYSMLSMIYKDIFFFLLLYVIGIYGVYKISMIVVKKIIVTQESKLVPIIKVVKEVNDTPIRSYKLRDNIYFFAELKQIEIDGVEKKLQKQASQLLELFLQSKENGYILKDSDIKESLWPDGSGGPDRIHKAIARLRNIIREFDESMDIKRGIGTYQLLL